MFPCPPKSCRDYLIAGSSLWWVGIVSLFLGNAWSLGRNYLACVWQLHKCKAVGCFPLPSRRLRACQSGELMGKIRGLGKHMTHSPRAVAGSQPSPACGSGLCQQQKNNTLPKRLGTMKIQALPLLQLPTLCIQMSCSSKPSVLLCVHESCQVPPGLQTSCLVRPSW